MLRIARFIAFMTIIISVMVLIYGGYTWVLTRQLAQSMAVSSTNSVNFSRVKPYLDGVVIDTVHLGNDIKLSTVYFEAYPWQMLRGKIRHIYIKEAKVNADTLLKKPVIWPFEHDTPLTVETILVSLSALGKKITFTGQMKQSPDIPLLLKMTSTTNDVILDMQGEIRIQDSLVQSMDFEFQDAQLHFPALETRRSSGWLSFTFDSDMWNVVGELESGFAKIPQQTFFDTTVKLSGTYNEADFSVTANEGSSGKAWVMERRGTNFDIGYLDQKKNLAWQNLDTAFLHKLGNVMTTFDKKEVVITKPAEPIKKPVAKKIETAKKEGKKQEDQKQENKKSALIAEKKKEHPPVKPPIKPHVTQYLTLKSDQENKNVTEQADAEPIPESTPESAQELTPQRTTYVSINDLTGNSIFAGFLFDRHLMFMPRVCVNSHETECWIARGQGGRFGYNANDPWAVPPYFSRLKDYREATKLRGLLVDVTISSLTLSGDRNGVSDMVIQGKDAHGRNLYIELSLVGLSSD